MIENIVKGQKITLKSNVYKQTVIYTFQESNDFNEKSCLVFYKHLKWIFRPPRIFIFNISYLYTYAA